MDDGEGRNTTPIIPADIHLSSSEKKAPDNRSARLEWFKSITELVKVLTWPIFALVLLLTFHDPLSEVISLIPRKLADATKVSIGSLSVEIQQKALSQGETKVAQGFSQLPPKAIERLLQSGKGASAGLVHFNKERTTYYFPEPSEIRVLYDLQKAGFIEFSESLNPFLAWLNTFPWSDQMGSRRIDMNKLAPGDRARIENMEYKITKTGDRAIDTLLSVITDQLRRQSSAEKGDS